MDDPTGLPNQAALTHWEEVAMRARARLERRRRAAATLVALGRITPALAEHRLRVNQAVVEAIEELA